MPKPPDPNCKHMWELEPPTSGERSAGRCSRCGGERDFGNYHTVDLNERPSRINNSDLFGGRR